SVIGLVSGVQGLYYWLRKPVGKMHWWFRHMTAMLGACVAATTAFLVVNAPFAGVSRGSLIVWFTPAVVGGVGSAVWTRYYRRRFAGRANSPAIPNAQGPMRNGQRLST